MPRLKLKFVGMMASNFQNFTHTESQKINRKIKQGNVRKCLVVGTKSKLG